MLRVAILSVAVPAYVKPTFFRATHSLPEAQKNFARIFLSLKEFFCHRLQSDLVLRRFLNSTFYQLTQN